MFESHRGRHQFRHSYNFNSYIELIKLKEVGILVKSGISASFFVLEHCSIFEFSFKASIVQNLNSLYKYEIDIEREL